MGLLNLLGLFFFWRDSYRAGLPDEIAFDLGNFLFSLALAFNNKIVLLDRVEELADLLHMPLDCFQGRTIKFLFFLPVAHGK